MAKINDTTTYPATTPAAGDLLIGTDISDTGNDANGETVNFSVQDLQNLTEINAQTGTTYTLVLADRAKVVTMNNAGANTLTIPTNSSVAFSVGTVINVIQLGAGTTTISGDTGVTVNGVSAGSGDINTQYNGASLLKIATDTWVASGDIGTVA